MSSVSHVPSSLKPKRTLRNGLLLLSAVALLGFIGFRVYQAQARAGKAKVAPATVMQLKVAELVTV